MSFRKIQVSNINSDATAFNDPLIALNGDETGTNSSDIGLILERGSLTNVAVIWDESEDQFALVSTAHTGATDGNIPISAYSDIKASTFIGALTGDVTGDVTGDLTGDVTGTVSSLSNHDTDSLSEGSSNLYYTDARWDTRLGTKTTDNLTEGNNLYHTTARVRAAISEASTQLSYNSTSGVLTFTQGNTDTVSEGSSNLYHTTARVQAISINNVSEDTTPQLGGDLETNGNDIKFGDSDKAIFGTGSDLQIYHDGSDSYIDDAGEGSLFLRSGTTYFQNADGTKTSIQTNSGAGQTLYYNNSAIFETTATGIDITDTTASNSEGPSLDLFRNNASPSSADYIGCLKFSGKSNTGTTRNYAQSKGKIADVSNGSEDGTLEFWVRANGSNKIITRMNENGILLTEDMTLKFEGATNDTAETTLTVADPTTDRTITLPDATGTVVLADGSGNVGIGTTSPQTTLDTGYTRIYNSGAASSPSAGKGLEVHYVTSGRTQGEGAYLISYDRDNSAYKQFVVDANNIELSTGGNNRLSIASGGNVGIGTESPLSTLHVRSNTQDGTLRVGGSGASLGLEFSYDQSGATTSIIQANPTYTNDGQLLKIRTDGDRNTNQIVLTGDGHVGFGTSTPADANWSSSTYGNTEVAIDGDGGYAVLHLRGDGAGSTDTRYSMGVGDGKFYMAYDDVTTTHRICVESNGNVGIGNTGAAAKLHVSGDIYATGDVTAYYSSDINLKENIVNIENALDKVNKIRGVHYDWKDEYIEKHSYVEKEDVGVIAQEVEKVLPEIVTDREDGTKAVKYDRLTALLIEAVKELSAKVDAQQEEINILKGK